MGSIVETWVNDVAGRTRRKIGGIYAVLAVFNLSAWVWAFVAFRHYPALVGTAFLAYSLGLRHAVDAVRHIGGLVGTLASTLFLFGIAIVNLAVLRSVYLAFRRVRRGERYVEEDFDLLLGSRGFLSRLFRP